LEREFAEREEDEFTDAREQRKRKQQRVEEEFF
jgi:hypothetical protein